MRHKTIVAAASAACALIATQAAALRCNGQLVNLGDSITEVRENCGKPYRSVKLIGKYGGQIGTAYYYDAGYGQADRKVIFNEGRVVTIRRLD